jgi:drug/metabolite transporter (DMT)-like permease
MTSPASVASPLFTARTGNPARHPMAGYALALGAATCFAASASVAARLVRSDSSPWDLSQLRIFGSFAVLVLLAAIRPRSLRLPRRVWGHVVVFGLVALLGTQATFYAALQDIPVAVTGLVQQVGPMLVLVVGLALGRRRPPRSVWFACGIAFGGLYLVSGAYRFRLFRQDAVGIALALASAACFAAYFVVGERLAGSPTRAILTWGYAVAAGGWIVIDLVRRRAPELPSGSRSFDLVVIILVGTLIPTVFNTAALRRLGAAAGALTTVATPPLSGLVAWIELDERLAPARIVGGALTLAALGWIQARDIRASTRAPTVLSAEADRVLPRG